MQYTQIPKLSEKESEENAPTKLAINVEGGFQTNDRYTLERRYFLAVWMGTAFEDIPLPNPELPEFVSNVCDAIIQHNGMKLRAQVLCSLLLPSAL